MDPGQPRAAPRLVQRRSPGLQYFVEHHAGSLVILTNGGAGREYVVMTCPLAHCERRRAARCARASTFWSLAWAAWAMLRLRCTMRAAFSPVA